MRSRAAMLLLTTAPTLALRLPATPANLHAFQATASSARSKPFFMTTDADDNVDDNNNGAASSSSLLNESDAESRNAAAEPMTPKDNLVFVGYIGGFIAFFYAVAALLEQAVVGKQVVEPTRRADQDVGRAATETGHVGVHVGSANNHQR